MSTSYGGAPGTSVSVALVTGGGRGIGRTLARELTRAGWTVVVAGRTEAALDDAVARGDAALAMPGDAADPAAVRAAVQAARELGDLDLVVANAGRFTAAGPIWESDPAVWWADTELNLRGPALVMHAALGDMVNRGRGRVVVIGSGIGIQPMPWASAYASSKAAAMRLVDSVGGELEGTGVTVFAISPGLVDTDLTEFPAAFLEHYPEMGGQAKREGRPPEQCAALVLELASGRHDHLSGKYVHVRDDLTRAAEGNEESGTLRLVPYPA
jgi:NAD(P)-dependent dehydrogenase (short-subunit alcohol dehydrogenase family)